MNVASHIASFKERGFPTEQAEILTLMSVATAVLFQDFPDSFLLFGGSSLVFFHQSVRHSADIDLLSRTEGPPSTDAILKSLGVGLADTAEALSFAPLQFEVIAKTHQEVKLLVRRGDGKALFSVDLSRFGSVLESEIDEHTIAVDDQFANIKSASPQFLLLQKAECFLLRKYVKSRDAYDIHQLKSRGATLDDNLRSHLSDTLSNFEIERRDIVERIEWVNDKRCRSELQPLLPPPVFEVLSEDGFKGLRDVLYRLYQDWL